MSDKRNIEELMRSALEGAEISPSEASWTQIQRQLRWKQFLRFQPARFNIYYLAALLLAGIGLTLLLTGKDTSDVPVVPNGEADQISRPLAPLESADASAGEAERSFANNNEQAESPDPDHSPATDAEKDTMLQLKDSSPAEEGKTKLETIPLAPVVRAEPRESLKEQMPVSNFIPSVQSGCAPLVVHFTDQSLHATSWHWDFGTGETSREQHPAYEFTEAGRYMVTLTTENHSNPPAVSRMMIEVLPAPVADFQIQEGMTGMDDHVVLSLLNYSTDATEFSWCLVDKGSSECGTWRSIDHQPSVELKSITPDSRAIRLEAIAENGCRDTAVQDLPLIVESSETRIKFPTAFSPNPSGPGDGSFAPGSKRIDLFHPIYIVVPVEYRLRIFTRRGELIFETRDIYQGWDGYHNQEAAASDVYVWMAEGRWKDGKSFSLHGDVTLVKGQYW